MKRFNINTNTRDQMIDITAQVQAYIDEVNVKSGVCVVYVPHTTAGVTINENADPDVQHDIIEHLDQIIPWRARYFQHAEGNSAAHLKASFMGSSAHVIIEDGRLVLGTWQSIFFCEFDGPRRRSIIVKILKDN